MSVLVRGVITVAIQEYKPKDWFTDVITPMGAVVDAFLLIANWAALQRLYHQQSLLLEKSSSKMQQEKTAAVWGRYLL